MKSTEKIVTALDQKVKKVRETPEGFAFFVSLHHFVEFVEATPEFGVFFIAAKKKGSRATEISAKYSVLKEVHQGIKDLDLKTTVDLGHDRYVAIRELGLIRDNNLSNNNSYWKRREFLRKLVGDIHETFRAHLLELGGIKPPAAE